ncbi:Predicted membrane protein [Cedecea neteri]|uniref:Predicted membrane protein n=1 Tax=Cedecea neteri TaxID=158822 RepID=A0A2X3IIP5_9ENTR|nr:Predicted membrane protein [Cedecea neteri]
MKHAMSFSLKPHLFARLRLLISVAAGIVCYYVLPAQFGTLQRLLISWNVLAWLYLTFIWFRMLRTDVNEIQRIARIQDQSAALVLSMVIFACMASIVAILERTAVATFTFWHSTWVAHCSDRHDAAGVLDLAAQFVRHALRPITTICTAAKT